jgi:hypothetical protein
VDLPYTFYGFEEKKTDITLHSCEADVAPKYADEPGVDTVGTIVWHFSTEDLQWAKQGFDKSGTTYMYRFDITLTMRKHPDKGVLEFTTTAAGREVGHATIEFI